MGEGSWPAMLPLLPLLLCACATPEAEMGFSTGSCEVWASDSCGGPQAEDLSLFQHRAVNQVGAAIAAETEGPQPGRQLLEALLQEAARGTSRRAARARAALPKVRAALSEAGHRMTPALRANLSNFCDLWEVCQCEAGTEEASTTCRPGSCRYSQTAWKICAHMKPHCGDWKSWGWPTWKFCEWANFGKLGKYPGDDELFVTLPSKEFSSGILGNIPKVTVFSDQDDTITCTGGLILGMDTICAGTHKGGMYPGVAEFYLALTQGPSGALPKQKVIPCSARPRQFKAVLRISADSPQNNAFKEVGGSDWGFNVKNALYGDVTDDLDFFGSNHDTDFGHLGYTKFKDWKKMVTADTWQGGSSIFVGDDGEGDLVAAEMMLKSGHLLAAFIHDVKQACKDTDCRDTWRGYGVFLFDNYVEAAGIALAEGLITKEGCERVCQATDAELFTCDC